MALQKTAAGKAADAKASAGASAKGASSKAKPAKKGLTTGKKIALVMFALIAVFVFWIFSDEGEGEGETVVGPHGLLAGEDIAFQYDTNEIPMQYFTEKIPDWKYIAWKDLYVPELPREDIIGKVANSTQTGVPVGIFFYNMDSDLHRFDVKRFWSKTSKYFTRSTKKTIEFYRVRCEQRSREDSEVIFNSQLYTFHIDPSGIQASIYLWKGGSMRSGIKLPLRGTAVELIEDLDFLTEPRSYPILEYEEAKKEAVAKAEKHNETFEEADLEWGITNFMKKQKSNALMETNYTLFQFINPGEGEKYVELSP